MSTLLLKKKSMSVTSPKTEPKLRATEFYKRQGYEIINTLGNIFDFIASNNQEIIFVQIYTTKERMWEAEKIKYSGRAHMEILKYEDDHSKETTPTNRMIYPRIS